MVDITVEELNERREKGDDIFLLDVREFFEHDISNIEGEVIPFGELHFRLDEIGEYRDKEIVVYCRTGSRSAEAVVLLHENGFKKARNLTGGINEWARKIDPSLPVY